MVLPRPFCSASRKWDLLDYPDIAKSFDGADIPRMCLNLLRRALDPDGANRPADGQVFYLELRAIQAARKQSLAHAEGCCRSSSRGRRVDRLKS